MSPANGAGDFDILADLAILEWARKASPFVCICETVPGCKGTWLWRLHLWESSARGAESGTKLRLLVCGYLYVVVLRKWMLL
jgi:hypothetical protein